ncbi:hypothetical protein HDU77_004309 [Chytriomyces hyalinus]|nr:hypothetical protein HDU77_004309 [Chytriomyces hyalinus]
MEHTPSPTTSRRSCLNSGCAEPTSATENETASETSNDKLIQIHEHEDERKKAPSKRVCGIEWNRKRVYICAGVSAIILLVSGVALYFMLPKIAQSSIDSSVMTLTSTKISMPSNSSFALEANGTVSNAGIFDAALSFPGQVSVYWTNREGAQDLLLGSLSIPTVSVSGGLPKSGSVALKTQFSIANQDNMGLFAEAMIHAKSFSWLLVGDASATAMGMTFNNLKLNKVVTMNGFDGLQKVVVTGFSPLPGEGSSIGVQVNTNVTNPSSITIEMGDLFFKFKLGNGDGTLRASQVTMKGADVNALSMTGNVTVANTEPGSSMNTQIKSLGIGSGNGTVVQLNVQGEHCISPSGYVGWLNQGIRSLNMKITMDLKDIAQKSVSDAVLTLSSTSLDQIQASSFHLVGTGTASNAGTMDAVLSFPDPVQVYWTSRPGGASNLLLGSMRLSPVTVGGESPKSGPISLDTVFSIVNSDDMAQFATYMMQGSSFSWSVVGIATAEAFGISFPGLKLEKTITLVGFNSLPNPSVSAFNLPDSDSSGIHVVTTAVANNPSSIAIDMGSLAFTMLYNNINIGSLTASNVILKPGANSLAMDGRMITGKDDVATASTLMTNFLGGQGLAVKVTGSSVKTNGVQVNWLNTAFKTLTMAISIPSPPIKTPIISGFNIPALRLSMNENDPSGSVLTASADLVTANFKPPFTFRIGIQRVESNLQMFDQASGTAFATLNLPISKAELDASSAKVMLKFDSQKMAVIPGQEGLLAQFFKTITEGTAVSVGIKGSVSAEVSTDAGDVKISNIAVTDSLVMNGFDGLKRVTIGDAPVVGGDSQNGLKLSVSTEIQNPSSVALDFKSNVEFDIYTAGVKIGVAIMPNVNLLQGKNVAIADCFLNGNGDPSAVAAIEAAMSNYLQNIKTPITLRGKSNSVKYESFKSAMSSVSIDAVFPAKNVPLVLGSTLSIAFKLIPLDIHIQLTMNIQNPLEAPITMLALKSDILFDGKKIGTLDHTFTNPTVIPAGGQATTEQIKLNPIISLQDLQLILPVLQKRLQVDSVNSITNLVGSYPSTISYSQNVPVAIKLL